MEHRWIVGYWKADISTMCSSVMRALSNNENRIAIAFQMAELSIIEYDIFKFFPTLHIWNRKWNEAGRSLSGLVYLITGWMEHIMRPTPRSSVQNSGRDSRTSRTHRQTDRADRSNTQIPSWMNLRNKTARILVLTFCCSDSLSSANQLLHSASGVFMGAQGQGVRSPPK
jgi:hypothetical protein